MRKNFLYCIAAAAIAMAASCSKPLDASYYNTIADTLYDDTTGAMVLHYVNQLGQELKMESYIHDSVGDSWFLFGAMTNSYNDRGLVDSQVFYMPDIADLQLKPLELDIWSYDEAGNIIESRHCVSGGDTSQWTNISKYTYLYCGDTLIREKYFGWIPEVSAWQMQHSQYLTYDSLGNHSSTLHFEIDQSDTTRLNEWIEQF